VTLTLTSDDHESHIIVNVSSTLTNTTIWFVAANDVRSQPSENPTPHQTPYAIQNIYSEWLCWWWRCFIVCRASLVFRVDRPSMLIFDACVDDVLTKVFLFFSFSCFYIM